jgi:hypothetical protein
MLLIPESISQSRTNAIDECVRVVCDDVGEGVDDFDKMRCVFFTSKTDSNLKRGRMGRGFKEMLVVAQNARVESKGRVIEFTRDADGTTGVATRKGTRQVGTRVSMSTPWSSKDAEDIVSYFQRVLVPEGVDLKINGDTIRPRKAKHLVEALLPTEVFDGGRWLKPARKTQVRLVPVINGEVPTVCEMGIPVCPLEWDQAYHLDVAQRIPMNPPGCGQR